MASFLLGLLIVVVALIQFSIANNLEIISRSQWNALPSVDDAGTLSHPIKQIVVAHTVSYGCLVKTDCMSRMRSIQKYHLKALKYPDIAYNFLIGGDGSVYEGCGWNKVGRHTKNNNKDTLAIAFIGKYSKKRPSVLAMRNMVRLIQEGVRDGKINKNYKIYGQRDLISTNSPGDALYREVKQFARWAPKP